MANRRVLIKRRKAVRNIRKITRTMQLIATARFQAAYNRAMATKPYTEKLAELVADISSASDDLDHPLMQTHDDAGKSAVVILTSMRGLCGGYNANILRSAITHLDQQKDKDIQSDISMVGVKGINFFKFLGREISQPITDISDIPQFDQVEPMANDLMNRFIKGEISSAYVVYMKFISTGKQKPEVLQLLPLSHETKRTTEDHQKESRIEYEFSPDPVLLMDELLPATVRIRLFQCFTDATVSEHVSRMVAMKAATDAAEDMITALTRKYNRARQTHITMELLDIIGGANALE